jgi:hypothetical protein
MNDPQIGWIAAIIVGGIAGWLAEQFMKKPNGACDEHRPWHHRGRSVLAGYSACSASRLAAVGLAI